MTLLQQLHDKDAVPLYYDHCWDEIIDGIVCEVFSSLSDDCETMGGIGVTTYHAIGFDKNDKVVRFTQHIYSDREENDDWYEDI